MYVRGLRGARTSRWPIGIVGVWKTGETGVETGVRLVTPLVSSPSNPGEVGGEVSEDGGVTLPYFRWGDSTILWRGGGRRCTGMVVGAGIVVTAGVSVVVVVVTAVGAVVVAAFSCSCVCLYKNCDFTL